jgi:glycogen phosphorylase
MNPFYRLSHYLPVFMVNSRSIFLFFDFENFAALRKSKLIFAVSLCAMTNFRTQTPSFDLPRKLARLGDLAFNLWWTWQPEAGRLFSQLDRAMWERLNHNPIRMLREIKRARLNEVLKDRDYMDSYKRVFADFDAYMAVQDTWSHRTQPKLASNPIAYFSMEFGLHETLPIYSGGLGVLAGDHLKEASDLGLPLTGVGFMYAQGYFSQRISEDGWQEALNNMLTFEDLPANLVVKDGVPVYGRSRSSLTAALPCTPWEVRVGRIPLYLLDSNVEGNSDSDRLLTARLYWSDLDRRIMQEVLLGIGGVRMLRALGANPTIWHMNEGHAAFLILERARELVEDGDSFETAIQKTRGQNIFTTHTPVPAGNDEFPLWLMDKYLAAVWPQLGLTREQFYDLARHEQTYGETFSMGCWHCARPWDVMRSRNCMDT